MEDGVPLRNGDWGHFTSGKKGRAKVGFQGQNTGGKLLQERQVRGSDAVQREGAAPHHQRAASTLNSATGCQGREGESGR